MLNWQKDQVKYINQTRSKRLYETLVNWAINNPLECITYDIEYSLYNILDASFTRLNFGHFKFEYKNIIYNIIFETSNILEIQTFLSSDVQQSKNIKLKELRYYSILYYEYVHEYVLYSDKHLKTHDDLIDWFVNISKIMKDKESTVLFLISSKDKN